MSHYAAGRRYEWEIQEILEREGYVVTRAAGSKGADGWDLHARKVVRRGRTRELWVAVYVQAKCHTR